MKKAKRDGRTIDHKAMEEIRVRAVQQVQSGENPEVVIKALGFHRSCIYEWLAQYRAGGWLALRSRRGGGPKPRLSGKQIQWIYRTITLGDPRQFKFPYALWSRKIIGQVILEKWAVRLSLASVGRLLAQLGLSCQRPLYRAYQQNPSLVEEWLQKEYPKIRRLARQIGARIYFGDEAGIRSASHSGRTWAPRGQTPIITTTGERFGLNMISAVRAQGECRFMVVQGSVRGEEFCEFLRRLMYKSGHPMVLIVDGHPTHRSGRVQKYVQSLRGKLRLCFLPPYSPELNPDELVWNDLKGHMGRMDVRDRDEMKQEVQDYFVDLANQPEKIRSFFQAKHTRYAA